MKKIEFENFRIFKNRASLNLAPITVLTGKNNSGKSTVLKGLLLLSDSDFLFNDLRLRFNGKTSLKHKIKNFGNALSLNSESKTLLLGVSYDEYTISYEFFGQPDDTTALLKSVTIQKPESKEFIKLSRQSGTFFHLKSSENFFDLNDISSSKNNEEVSLLKTQIEKTKEAISTLNKSAHGIISNNDITMQNLGERQQLKQKLKLLTQRIKKIESDIISDMLVVDTDIKAESNYSVTQLFNVGLKKFLNETGRTELYDIILKSKKFKFLYHNFGQWGNPLFFHISPFRFYQSRLYLKNDESHEINKFLNNYQVIKPGNGTKEHLFLTYWVNKFNIGIDIEIKSYEGEASSLFVVNNNKEEVNITDMGFGAGQALTLLLMIISAEGQVMNDVDEQIERNEVAVKDLVVLLIEEPETNLHPKFQSLLAELFADAYEKFRIRFVIETHSEYLIRKIQTIVKENGSNELFKIYYFDTEKGPYEMRLSDSGKFLDEFGTGFFDEARNLAFDIL